MSEHLLALDLGTTTLRADNGIRVIVRPTTLQTDEIVVSGFQPGGSAALPPELYLASLVASQVASASGLQGMSVGDLARQMVGRALDADVSLGGWSEIFYGESTREEWPAMLELLHARITRPRFDPEVYAEIVAARREQVRRSMVTPEARLNDRWLRLVWQDHPNHVPWTEADLDRLSLADVERAWRMRLNDLSGTVLFVVGNITPDEARDALAQWVATLPGEGPDRANAAPDLDDGARRPAGPVAEVLVDEAAVQANVRVLFHAPWEDGPAQRLILDGMGSLLEARLHEELREALGGTYGVGVSESIQRHPVEEAVLTIEFSCDPARVDELLAAMDEVIEETRTRTWPASVMGSFREKNLREREAAVQSNAWWAGAMAGHWRRGESPGVLLDYAQDNLRVTGAAVREAAVALLQDAHRVQLVQTPLGPEGEAAPDTDAPE